MQQTGRAEATERVTLDLSREELDNARERLPILYVDAVPVRTSPAGEVLLVGLLLRGMPDGSISRAVVSGRVLYGERVREPGILEAFNLSPEDAEALIMRARIVMGWVEAPPEPEYEEEVEAEADAEVAAEEEEAEAEDGEDGDDVEEEAAEVKDGEESESK